MHIRLPHRPPVAHGPCGAGGAGAIERGSEWWSCGPYGPDGGACGAGARGLWRQGMGAEPSRPCRRRKRCGDQPLTNASRANERKFVTAPASRRHGRAGAAARRRKDDGGGTTRAHANGAPGKGRRRKARQARVTKRAPSLPGQAPKSPGPARLPRLVARGYTGFNVSVRTLRPVTSFFLRRIRWLVKPPA
jgi:hypothetical protein